MNKEQLHYLDTLKIAIQYLKINSNSMDNFQLVKIYQQVKNAEFRGLNKKYRIDNLDTQNNMLGNNDTWLKLSSDTKQPILVTLSPDFDYKFSIFLGKHKSVPKLVKHMKHVSMDFVSDIMFTAVSALFLLIDGLLQSGAGLGLTECGLAVLIIVGGVLNAIRLYNESYCVLNDHLTDSDELAQVIQGIYDNYKSVVGEPLLTEKHLRTIKKNKSSWADLEKRLVRQRRQAKIDA